MLKKITSLFLVICLFLSIATPALAKKSGGGGFSKPRTTSPTNQSTPSKTTDSGTTKTNETGSTDKIPYTNLPASKAAGTTGAAGAGAAAGRSNLSGFAPSFSPFSGNFWMWMFLMNSFGHRPATAQTEDAAGEVSQASSQAPVAAGGTLSDAEGVKADIYTPGVADYWEADPLANTVSTLLLLATIGVPIWLFLRWRKKRALTEA